MTYTPIKTKSYNCSEIFKSSPIVSFTVLVTGEYQHSPNVGIGEIKSQCGPQFPGEGHLG